MRGLHIMSPPPRPPRARPMAPLRRGRRWRVAARSPLADHLATRRGEAAEMEGWCGEAAARAAMEGCCGEAGDAGATRV